MINGVLMDPTSEGPTYNLASSTTCRTEGRELPPLPEDASNAV